MYKGPERRRYRRTRRHFVARFKILPHAAKRSGEKWRVVSTRNISAGGVLINYDKEIEIGSLLAFEIKLPRRKTPLNCVGKIVRLEEVPGSPVLFIAAKFTEINKDERKALEKAVAKISSVSSSKGKG